MKVVKKGLFASRNKLSAGIEVKCPKCESILETEENEPTAKLKWMLAFLTLIRYWQVLCPVCKRKVRIY